MPNENDEQCTSIVVPLVPVTVNLGPLGFHHYAAEFLDVADSVQPSSSFSPVTYYLYCHSIAEPEGFLASQGCNKNRTEETRGAPA